MSRFARGQAALLVQRRYWRACRAGGKGKFRSAVLVFECVHRGGSKKAGEETLLEMARFFLGLTRQRGQLARLARAPPRQQREPPLPLPWLLHEPLLLLPAQQPP